MYSFNVKELFYALEGGRWVTVSGHLTSYLTKKSFKKQVSPFESPFMIHVKVSRCIIIVIFTITSEMWLKNFTLPQSKVFSALHRICC